jgi:anti-anti-sigma factor
MKLKVLSPDAGLNRLECADDLTLLDVAEPETTLEDLLGPGIYRGKVLLSLAKAGYIDSAGVGWLILLHKHFEEAGGRLVVHSLPPQVRHAFDLLGLRAHLDIADDEAQARALAEVGRRRESSPLPGPLQPLPPTQPSRPA